MSYRQFLAWKKFLIKMKDLRSTIQKKRNWKIGLCDVLYSRRKRNGYFHIQWLWRKVYLCKRHTWKKSFGQKRKTKFSMHSTFYSKEICWLVEDLCTISQVLLVMCVSEMLTDQVFSWPSRRPVKLSLTGISHQEIFSLKLGDHFYWIREMTSTDKQDPFVTCLHRNTWEIMQISGVVRLTREHSNVICTILTDILLIIGS